MRRQSEYFSDYDAALQVLVEKGLVYRSFLTRSELNAELEARNVDANEAGVRPYSGSGETLSDDEADMRAHRGDAYSWRLAPARCQDFLGVKYDQLTFEEQGDADGVKTGEVRARPELLGDVILGRKDTPTSYHMAVTHDDACQGMTHIVRGRDLYHSTHIHVLLQALFRWPTPIYCHHGLLLEDDGRKFSKSDRSKTLRSLREEGVSPDDVLSGCVAS